jgi:phenylpropionate dioxygenase-like ring-hydroxylating dioxygenase large terminal subunit
MREAMEKHQVDMNICFKSYPQSWYPICLSKVVKIGKVLVQEAFAREWVLFRDKNNKIGMISRHCTHMGADLSLGKIVDGKIECPLHRWRYDSSGHCEFLSSEHERSIPSALPMTESNGIIFAFWGAKPLFPLPVFDKLKNPSISSPAHFILETAMIMIGVNTFDLAHYAPVHNRKLEGIPKVYTDHGFHLGIIYDASIKIKRIYDKLIAWIGHDRVTNQIDCIGGNIFLVVSHSTSFYSIFYALPVSSHKTKIFLVTACESNKGPIKKFLFDKFKTYLGRIFTGKFLEQDIVVAKNMRPRFDHPSLKEDVFLMRFFQFWQRLPKI